MDKKYISEIIYTLLDKGYSRDEILYVLYIEYEITKNKWLKENK